MPLQRLLQVKDGSLGCLMTVYSEMALRCFSPVYLSPISSPDDQQANEPRGEEGVVTCHAISFLAGADRNLASLVQY